jgi:hypothetical protein
MVVPAVGGVIAVSGVRVLRCCLGRRRDDRGGGEGGEK